jgi:uncharacterized protein YndB with AHSA1/START domain
MPVKKDALGRHWVEMEWLVPGTPEQVWNALATGPGISAWFVPASIEERVGGALSFSFGEMGNSSGTVTGWEPPRRFAYEERDWSENAPPVATEVVVTARSGGTCVVRMVHSLFASTDDWDDQLEGFESGWPGFFEVLRLYLSHFSGAPVASFHIESVCPAGQPEAWSRLTRALGIAAANVGEWHRSSEASAPLGGVVERIVQSQKKRELSLLLDQPHPGVALVGTYARAGQAHGGLGVFFYGEGATENAERLRASAAPWLERLLSGE